VRSCPITVTLDPSLTVYVEWSNEVWNTAPTFETYAWVTEQLALSENAGMDRWEFVAGQIRRDFDIWTEVFASQQDRLVRVVAGWQANTAITEQMVSHLARSDQFPAGATAEQEGGVRLRVVLRRRRGPGDHSRRRQAVPPPVR
jgi:hypothetical protein